MIPDTGVQVGGKKEEAIAPPDADGELSAPTYSGISNLVGCSMRVRGDAIHW